MDGVESARGPLAGAGVGGAVLVPSAAQLSAAAQPPVQSAPGPGRRGHPQGNHPQAPTALERRCSPSFLPKPDGFEEDDKGSLEVGKVGDIVILSKDLIGCDDSEIMDTKVLYTIVGGEVKHKL